MAEIGSQDRHFWLTQGMARAIGVNLTGAMASGTLDGARYARIVESCENCPFPESCTVWMSEQQGVAPGLPDYCANKSDLDALKARGS